MTSFLSAVVLGVGSATVAATAPAGTDGLRAMMESLRGSRVYFGHMSVGYNVVAGLGELSAESGVPLHVAEVSDSLAGQPAAFLHGPVPENGDPLRKLESFRRTVASAPAPGPDVALFKFCYVDFDERTDAAALFARYQATIADLRARFPETRFVHVTAPLTTVQGGLKAFAKSLLGRTPYGVVENQRREQYNQLLRRAYAGREPVLDLAAVESTTPDGKPFTSEWNGVTVPSLVPAYTDDGGHLNREGRRRVARELVSVLASVVRPGAAGAASR